MVDFCIFVEVLSKTIIFEIIFDIPDITLAISIVRIIELYSEIRKQRNPALFTGPIWKDKGRDKRRIMDVGIVV